MSVGVLLLVHTEFARAEQMARIWADAGCPVVIHVDAKVSDSVFTKFSAALRDIPDVRFCRRHRCDWGMWGIVAATQSAAELMLAEFQDVQHVYLSSGSCLPLRPIAELEAYLAARPGTDFIESVSVADTQWVVDGLSMERFTLRFPFSWKKQRGLFDRYVDLQRRLGVSRKIPEGLAPHMGSQWWCLTRKTLSAILNDPNRLTYDRYFKRVWVPDESYFQTLARQHADRIESSSLTFSKFDCHGKPHQFYDDHLQILRQSGCFVARKIWPGAARLYETFPNNRGDGFQTKGADGKNIEKLFEHAAHRRKVGRAGLHMQSRFQHHAWESDLTAGPYSVFQGFAELFQDFEGWLALQSGCKVHGHLFAPDRVEFEGRQKVFTGGLSDNAKLRDYNPRCFLTNLIWATRGHRQCFQYGPADTQANNWFMAKDPNAQISVISGAWAIDLLKSGLTPEDVRWKAAHFQSEETRFLEVLRSPWTKARVKIWTLAEFLESPVEPLQLVVDEMSSYGAKRLTDMPKMRDLTGFRDKVEALRNDGLPLYLLGNIAPDSQQNDSQTPKRRPYLVQ